MGLPVTDQRFTLDQIEDAMFNDGGFCLACGEPSEDPCEPDARDYECGSCGARKVYGASEILMMGLIDA